MNVLSLVEVHVIQFTSRAVSGTAKLHLPQHFHRDLLQGLGDNATFVLLISGLKDERQGN